MVSGRRLVSASINGLPQESVARLLQKSLIFMAFGHPEGFGLPLAEAAACGCYLIGYSGLGGRELLEIASSNHAGQEIPYGDWYAFVQACEQLNDRFNSDSRDLARCLLKNSKAIRDIYSADAMIQSVQIALTRWEAQLP